MVIRNRRGKVILINPAHVCSGFGVMTPRWMPVVAAATPDPYANTQLLLDQAVEPVSSHRIAAADLVAISAHTLNARRSYELVKQIKTETSATVVIGGPHATVCPDEVLTNGGADAVITGDADTIWSRVVDDWGRGALKPRYDGGRVAGGRFISLPRWDLVNHRRYLIATVHTTRGCPEACTFCSVWRTDGQEIRFRPIAHTIREIRLLYALGFRYVVLADDNFYAAGARNRREHRSMLEERFSLLKALATLPNDLILATQVTIRVADDREFLEAMSRGRIRLVLVGIETVDDKGLRHINKKFNRSGEALVDSVRTIQDHGVFVLGSHIVGLPDDTVATYDRMLETVVRSNMAFAQFVRYTYLPGTIDYEMLKRDKHGLKLRSNGDRYWLRPTTKHRSPIGHPTLHDEEIDRAVVRLWARFYSTRTVLARAWRLGLRNPVKILCYLLASYIHHSIYFRHGVAADSMKTTTAGWGTRGLGLLALRLTKGPVREVTAPAAPPAATPRRSVAGAVLSLLIHGQRGG